jgi:hypothetical protein
MFIVVAMALATSDAVNLKVCREWYRIGAEV